MAVNSFSVMSLGRVNLIDPHKVGYQDAMDILHDTFHRARKDFVKIGFYIKHIRDNELYMEAGYKTINEFAFDNFHLSQSSTSRYISICEQFSVDGNSPELDERFEKYNLSQLMEMVAVDTAKIEQIKPEMSVKQIKELKKEMKESAPGVEMEDDSFPGQTSVEKDFPEYMPESSYATSHSEEKENFSEETEDQTERGIIDGEFRELIDPGTADKNSEETIAPGIVNSEREQIKLPLLKNTEQRKEWLRNYQDWGLWYRDENIDVNYYKFDFPDGSRLICCEYPQREHEYTTIVRDEYYYHLLEKSKKKYGGEKTYDEKFRSHITSEAYLIEFLKKFK